MIGDVNNDGWPDLVVTSDCQTVTCVTGSIRLLTNNGDGTFTLTDTAIGPDKGGPLAIGDLNGDGNLDIVASTGVFLGNGDGTFTQNSSVALPGGTISIALADVNGDGKLDAIVADQVSVKVQLGNGDGTLQPFVSYITGGKRPLSVAVADFNGDGRPDIAVANECSSVTGGVCAATGSLGVLAGNGDGTFQPPVGYVSPGYQATSVAVADVNGDTKSDILVSNVCATKTNCASQNGVEAVFLNIFKAPVTVQVTSSLNPALINQPFNLMATVTSNVPIPDGSTVNFFYGATLLGSGTTTTGVAMLAGVSFPAYGSHTVTAKYPTDIYHNAGSGQFAELIHRFPTTTTLMSGENPSDPGVKVTFTATVASNGGPVPTGSVQFVNGTKLVGTVTLNNSGAANFTIAFSTSGTHNITVNYLGDTQSVPSSSDPLMQIVQE
ncbi:MAG: FG-GAP-like repeat-containing protein [Candidatus Sulfotelmatobacter sp.]